MEKQTNQHEISINLRGYPSQCSDTIYADIADSSYRGHPSVLMFFPNVISHLIDISFFRCENFILSEREKERCRDFPLIVL